MYNNIVFDLGGVVVNYSPRDYLVDQFFHEKIESQLYDAVFGSEEWLMCDRGELDWPAAHDIFLDRGKSLGLELEMQALLDDWRDMLTTRRATVALMRILKKKGFGIYYLSNIARETVEYLSDRDFWKLFDGGVASYEVGVLKPEPQIFETLLERYKLDPQTTIFTDDVRDNAAAAFHAGITGIQFKNVKSFIKMLVTYGIDV